VIALIVAAGATIALALSMLRLFAGPSLYDRALAANSVVVKAMLIAAAGAVAANEPRFADMCIALAAALLVVNVAAAKFFRARTFQAPLARAEER